MRLRFSGVFRTVDVVSLVAMFGMILMLTLPAFRLKAGEVTVQTVGLLLYMRVMVWFL